MKFKKLSPLATAPSRGSSKAAGFDLYTALQGSVTIPAGKTVMIGTGIAMEIPDGYYGALVPRSGLATKRGLRPANTPGTIDSDYRGEIIVALHNDSNEAQVINPDDRIAQLILVPYVAPELEEVEDLDDTDRGAGGFGSTGR